MGTRSAIGIRLGDKIKAVYCHWDGYIRHNGFILNNHYRHSTKVCELIANGDMSSLGVDVGVKHNFDAHIEKVQPGNFAAQTTYYGRDRDEEDVEFQVFTSEKDFVSYYADSEYFYLFEDNDMFEAGKWKVKYGNSSFTSLQAEIEMIVADEAV